MFWTFVCDRRSSARRGRHAPRRRATGRR